MTMTALERAELAIFFRGQNQDLKKSISEIRAEAHGLQGGIAGLSTSLKGLVGTYLSVQAAQRALQLMSLGENLESVQAGFNNIVGNGPQNLTRARAAVKGTIDDLRLMRIASEGVQSGLNFDQVLQILAFAEYRVSQFGENFENVFAKLANGLSLMNRGLPVTDRSLNQLQLSGRNVTEVLAKMNEQLARAEEKGGGASNTMARFDANIKNLQLQAGTFLKTVLSPIVELLNLAANRLNNPGNAAAAPTFQLPQAAQAPLTIKLDNNDQSGFARFLAGLEEEPRKDIFAGLRAQAQIFAKTQREALTNLRSQVELEIKVAQERGLREQDYITLLGERKDLTAQLLQLDKQDADQSTADADKARVALRERLEQERQLLDAKMSNGQATYADFRRLLDDQIRDNREFIENDRAAFISYLTARGRLRAEDKRQRESDEAEIYNTTRRFVDATLADGARSRTQRIADAYAIWEQTLALESLGMEQRRQIYADMAQLETEFTSIMTEQAQARVDLLNNILGNTFLSAFDDILNGSAKRFEEYLGDLGKALLRFLASQALLRFFAMLAGGPLAGLLGGALGGQAINSGSGNFDFGITSIGGMDLSRVIGNGVAAAQSYRDTSPVYNPVINHVTHDGGITIENHVDELGIYSIVRRGKRAYDRSQLAQ